MLVREAAEKMGRELAAGSRRREKLARVVLTLVKKAGLGPAARAAAPGLGAAFKKLLPYLGGAAAATGIGAGSYMLGKKQQAQPGEGGGGLFGGGQKPLWGQTDKRMLGRMNIDPKAMSARTQTMRDIGAGGAWRKQQHQERMNLIRGMFTQ